MPDITKQRTPAEAANDLFRQWDAVNPNAPITDYSFRQGVIVALRCLESDVSTLKQQDKARSEAVKHIMDGVPNQTPDWRGRCKWVKMPNGAFEMQSPGAEYWLDSIVGKWQKYENDFERKMGCCRSTDEDKVRALLATAPPPPDVSEPSTQESEVPNEETAGRLRADETPPVVLRADTTPPPSQPVTGAKEWGIETDNRKWVRVRTRDWPLDVQAVDDPKDATTWASPELCNVWRMDHLNEINGACGSKASGTREIPVSIVGQEPAQPDIEALLPSTFYAGRPLKERVAFMVDQWRRLVALQPDPDAQPAPAQELPTAEHVAACLMIPPITHAQTLAAIKHRDQHWQARLADKERELEALRKRT